MNQPSRHGRARRPSRSSLRLALAGLFATAMTGAFGQQVSTAPDAIEQVRNHAMPADPSGISNFAALRAKAAAGNRKLRLIGRLSQAALNRGAQVGAGRADSAAVLAAHGVVLTRLAAIGIEEARPLDDLPLIGFVADAAALDRLAQSGDIDALAEDLPARPHLADSGPLVRAPLAWAAGARGAGQTIAVLDTGVAADHPFLSGRVVEQACFSSNSPSVGASSVCPGGADTGFGTGAAAPCTLADCAHGTHVAGIAAGRRSGQTTFNGIAPDSSIFAVQVFTRVVDTASSTTCRDSGRSSPCVVSFTSDQIRALRHVWTAVARRNVVAVNMSLGGGRFTGSCESDMRKPMIDILFDARVATVVGSGNDGFSDAIGTPACIPAAIAVGSTRKTDTVAASSNSSSLLDLLAPGVGITSSLPGGGFGPSSGTSMAAPHVAGAFAAIRSRVPTATVQQALHAIKVSGVPISDPRSGLTVPRLDLAGAVDRAVASHFPLGVGGLFQRHATGVIWAHTGVDCSGGVCPGWKKLDNNSATAEIAVAADRLYQRHAGGAIWTYTNAACIDDFCPGWKLLDNDAAAVAITAGGSSLYKLQSTGRVYRYTGIACGSDGVCPGWSLIDADATTTRIVADGANLYQLRSGGAILRHVAGTSWVTLGSDPATRNIVAAGGTLYQLQASGRVLRRTATATGWTLLSNNPAVVDIVAAPGRLFARRGDGSMWRFTGAVCSSPVSCPGWERIDPSGPNVQMTASASGAIFKRTSDGGVWRASGSACPSGCVWTQVDNNRRTQSIVAARP